MISGNNPTSLVDAYIFHLTNERRLSPLTCESYARDMAALLKLAAEIPLYQLKIHHIRRFVAQQRTLWEKSGENAISMARPL
jgi:integrase/recombinase XerC